MRKILVITVFSFCIIHAFALEGGVSYSVFVPETLYKYREGSIAIEQELSTSIGITEVFSIPIGIRYHHADGYEIEDENLAPIEGPSLFGDSFSLFVMAEAKIPVSVLYFKVFGGGIVSWVFTTRPYTGFFDQSLSSTGTAAVTSYSITPSTGWGWTAGGAAGVALGQFSIDLGLAYRSITHELKLDAQGYEVDAGTVSGPIDISTNDAVLILRGITVSIGVSVTF